MLNVAILGGSGYTGSELLRLLLRHPHVKITAVTSERYAGLPLSRVFLNFREKDITFEPLELSGLKKKAELFFLCLPHKTSQEIVAILHRAGRRVIDLSADYRLRKPAEYRRWYDTEHRYTGLLKKAVYGLPEIYRNSISKAAIVANPGCYPTGALLALAPAMTRDWLRLDSIVIDSKSGVSGAGRNPAQQFMFCEAHESVMAYAVASHRHTPEIEQELSLLSGASMKVIFTPHLIPMSRGILSTVYAKVRGSVNIRTLRKIYMEYYSREPFVRILDNGLYPSTGAVRGSNFCDISLFLGRRDKGNQTLIIVSAIDNLLKGASGQAVHNMNIMYGFEETDGLLSPPPHP
jgi:N-acetyl-gamma-glutamyl-phosphate reductase